MDVSLRKKAHGLWHTQRVKRMVRDSLGGDVQCLVSVRETLCTEPGCEGPATEIRIVTLGFQEIRAVVHKEASDIIRSDLTALRLG
ncbi:MAG: hypothetical protein AAGK79_19395 [Pseudomonadota bacterium]